MWFVLFGEFGECVAEFNTEAEAVAYIEKQSCSDDYWISNDEDFEPSNIDSDFGFDPYLGEYTYDC